MSSLCGGSLTYDVVVIGGGHAGCEAAHAAAKMGCRTLLVTLSLERIGFLSCNPAVGGLAKGQLVREIDALGGLMARVTDRAAIQYRKLNASKGPAVRSPRAQCDKERYPIEMQTQMSSLANLTLHAGEVTRIITEKEKRVSGVVLDGETTVLARSVVLAGGTFLRGVMHRGRVCETGGRQGDGAAGPLSEWLSAAGFLLRRLKTGTPPRLHKASIDWSRTEVQPGDAMPSPFSFYHRTQRFPFLKQVNCYLTYTNHLTHEIIAANLFQSPMFSGQITGQGPRYCPSIEDKVNRFRDKERHQVFLEPEGLECPDIYVNGVSTSLPADVQERFIRSIVGLERAEFLRYGYAVEYDAIDSRQLLRSLESKDIEGLFFAGQVNGTSGYEEAGAQGMIAGVNAARRVQEQEAVIFSRHDGYLGVMVDDLVLHGADEPYRMFTSRAEYRLHLREDNADLRLSQMGYDIGLLGEESYRDFVKKRDEIAQMSESLKSTYFYPRNHEVVSQLQELGQAAPKERTSAWDFLKRPGVTVAHLEKMGLIVVAPAMGTDVREQVEIQVKYDGYIKRDLEILEAVRRSEAVPIPREVDFGSIPGLSTEMVVRLQKARPETLGQVGRLPGLTPAAVANLMIFLKMHEKRTPGRPNEA